MHRRGINLPNHPTHPGNTRPRDRVDDAPSSRIPSWLIGWDFDKFANAIPSLRPDLFRSTKWNETAALLLSEKTFLLPRNLHPFSLINNYVERTAESIAVSRDLDADLVLGSLGADHHFR